MLEIKDISKNFGAQSILNQVNLTIRDAEFFSLLGPSGCGKTTLLRILAGLENASNGKILLCGEEIQNLQAQERPFNMVFQRYALFPHMTVEENLNFGLEVKKISTNDKKQRIKEMLELVGLTEFKSHYPETLSGGQAQRVALARALVNRPKIVLLDEPLSALDLKMREHMQRELRFLQKKLGLTFIYVTHDQDEAMVMSDRVGVMNGGRLEQISNPRDLYELPASTFVAQFVGVMNSFHGEIIDINQMEWSFKLQDGRLLQARKDQRLVNLEVGNKIQAFFRPEKIELSKIDSNNDQKNTFNGKIIHSIFKGNQFETYVETEAHGTIRVMSPHHSDVPLNIGDRVYLKLPSEHFHLFKKL